MGVLLVLEDAADGFGARLASVAERRGLRALVLCSAQLVREVSVSFRIDACGARLRLRHRGTTLDSRTLRAAYCGIETFTASAWPMFSPEDAEYAAREMHALWLAILASLPCGAVNPPALDALGGTALSTPELLSKGRAAGLEVPAVATLESGVVAARVLRAARVASVADLGEAWVVERPPCKSVRALRRVENELRLTEGVAGRTVHVALVGRRLLASMPDGGGTLRSLPAAKVPRPVRARLGRLQRVLRLRVAEYAFAVDSQGRWVLTGAMRPPRAAAQAHGDGLYKAVLDEALGRAAA
jgi:hypothetical protein